MDALNALSITTHALDDRSGTDYHRCIRYYLEYAQENDLTCNDAMTDPKGDLFLPPHAHADLDLYLRIVEKKPGGLVVRGAKAHQTGAVNSHEIIVMTTGKPIYSTNHALWHQVKYRFTLPILPWRPRIVYNT